MSKRQPEIIKFPNEALLMTEYFDKVDHNDHVIGKISREQAHKFNLLHRAVHIFIKDRNCKWLIQKRSAKKDLDPLLLTTSCSGHVDSGETYLEAAVRECEEELGLRISSKDLTEILRCSPCWETGMEFVRVYFFEKISEKITPSPHEIDEIVYFKLEELIHKSETQKAKFSGSFLHIFSLIKAKLSHYSRES